MHYVLVTDDPIVVSDKLLDVLDLATTSDNRARDAEPLFGHLRFEAMTEKDSCKC